jgi:hypothetical protein
MAKQEPALIESANLRLITGTSARIEKVRPVIEKELQDKAPGIKLNRGALLRWLINKGLEHYETLPIKRVCRRISYPYIEDIASIDNGEKEDS